MSNKNPTIQFDQPALQVVGLEDSIDADDTLEHSQLPSPTGFGAEQSPDQLAYVQRCLLQIKDRMAQQIRDTEHKAHNNASMY